MSTTIHPALSSVKRAFSFAGGSDRNELDDVMKQVQQALAGIPSAKGTMFAMRVGLIEEMAARGNVGAATAAAKRLLADIQGEYNFETSKPEKKHGHGELSAKQVFGSDQLMLSSAARP